MSDVKLGCTYPHFFIKSMMTAMGLKCGRANLGTKRSEDVKETQRMGNLTRASVHFSSLCFYLYGRRHQSALTPSKDHGARCSAANAVGGSPSSHVLVASIIIAIYRGGVVCLHNTKSHRTSERLSIEL